jgi:hypothetical protein
VSVSYRNPFGHSQRNPIASFLDKKIIMAAAIINMELNRHSFLEKALASSTAVD